MLNALIDLHPSDDITRHFFEEDGCPTKHLKDLLKLYGLWSDKDTIDPIVKKTQSSWLAVKQGRLGQERADLIDDENHHRLREKILQTVQLLGLFEARNPTRMSYRYALCLGAFLQGSMRRLQRLIDLWKSGIRFDALVFLGGERFLRSQAGQQDDLHVLAKEIALQKGASASLILKNLLKEKYQTEFDLLKIIWHYYPILDDMFEQLNKTVVFVDAPRVHEERPSTGDTFDAWIAHHQPEPGPVLAMSSSLLCHYQHLVGINHLGSKFTLETIGNSADPSHLKIRVILDTLAKRLYEMQLSKDS